MRIEACFGRPLPRLRRTRQSDSGNKTTIFRFGIERHIAVRTRRPYVPLGWIETASGKSQRLCAAAIVLPVYRAGATNRQNARGRLCVIVPLNVVDRLPGIADCTLTESI